MQSIVARLFCSFLALKLVLKIEKSAVKYLFDLQCLKYEVIPKQKKLQVSIFDKSPLTTFRPVIQSAVVKHKDDVVFKLGHYLVFSVNQLRFNCFQIHGSLPISN